MPPIQRHFQFDKHIFSRILTIAWPLTFSMTGTLIMMMADTLFLAKFSSDALAAVGPAGVTLWMYESLFMGMANYATPLVAQCVGKGDNRRIGSILWQGVYLAIGCGLLLLALSPLVALIFDGLGHAAPVRQMEHQYFRIMCAGLGPGMAGAVLNGFYAGRGSTRPLMLVQLAGVGVNALLDYALIFGRWGLPRWGVAGAAWATVAAQWFKVGLLAAMLLRHHWRSRYGTSQARFSARTLMLYVRFGLPSGFRIFSEAFAWSLFTFFVAYSGEAALAASNIAHRLNMVAFLPIWGVAEAVRTLVGQAQGRRDPATSERVVWHGLAVVQIWMLLTGALFLAAPHILYGFFAPGSGAEQAVTDFASVAAIGAVLLRYVAAYCLLDALNIVFSLALQAAGDTRWSMNMSLVAHGILAFALWLGHLWRRSVHVPWSIATVFVLALALVWLARFRRGVWRGIVVIE